MKVLDYVVLPSRYHGEFGVIQAKVGRTVVTFIANSFMLGQLKAVIKDEFPLSTSIEKNGNYFIFGDLWQKVGVFRE
jgi:hypothetical protein